MFYIKKFIKIYKYPQREFSAAIIKDIKKKNIIGELLDCPCGTGETSYHFSNISDKINVTAIDIDINQIELGKKNFGENITFKIQPIISALRSKKYSIICIINSLFLFENAKEVLNLEIKYL